MANLMDKFKKNVIGSRNIVADYTSKIDPTAEFHRVTQLQAILNSWNNILLTPRRTYDHDPEYGSDLHKYVFEPTDVTTLEGIKDEIKRSLMVYDTRATITNIDVVFLAEKKGFSVNIYAEYENEEGHLSAKFDEMTYMQ